MNAQCGRELDSAWGQTPVAICLNFPKARSGWELNDAATVDGPNLILDVLGAASAIQMHDEVRFTVMGDLPGPA